MVRIECLDRFLTSIRRRVKHVKGPAQSYEMKRSLSKIQLDRRKAIKELDAAANTHLVTELPDGQLTLSQRGVIVTALSSGTVYYFIRLILRDLLGRYPWYRLLNAKADRSKMFELYFLSIINAGIMSGHSAYKLLCCEENCTKGVTRMMATSIGYFLHDFVAMRYEFINDKGMLLHHVLCLAMCGTALQQDSGVKKLVPTVALTELSSVFLGLRWLLIELGLGKTKMYSVVLGLFDGTSFFATRIVGLQSYLFKVWNDTDLVALFPLRWLLATLAGLNVYWFYKIAMMAKKQLM